MKRLHIHVAVENLEASIQFYSTMFATTPTVTKPDYAKWMLDDPRVNFAISSRGASSGVNHLGVQLDTSDELGEMRARLQDLQTDMIEETGKACCYARSDKYWVTDPQGIPWETFHSLESIPLFGEEKTSEAACCVPLAPEPNQNSPCCVPQQQHKSAAGV
jgi:predicted enzyme related to lactoylglutathione lyase